MINAIHAASSEIIFGDFGMMAISKTNPNHVFGVNSEGWYISQDGGATPKTIATAQGIYADALFAGTLWLTNDMNIESADGYLNVTGSRFVMRSKTNTNNAVEITPEGMTIHGFDGREFIVDGIMRGSRVANINFFKTGAFTGDSGMVFDGMNWYWDGNTGAHNVHYVDDKYSGRFLDFVVASGLRYNSGPASARVAVRVTEFNDTVVSEGSYFVHRDDEDMNYQTLRVDLQSLYGVVPDYRTIKLYVQVEVTVNRDAVVLFRINRGEFNG